MLIFVYKIVLFQIKFDKNSNQNFKIAENWLQNHPNFEGVKPDAGAVAFIPIKKPIHTHSFYETDLNTHQTILGGPEHWFEQSDQFFRLGFGFPIAEELVEGFRRVDGVV